MKRSIQMLMLVLLIAGLCLTSCGTPETPSEVPGSDTSATSNESASEAATETEPATEAATETEPATEAATETEPATEAATETEPATEAATETEPATEAASETEPATEAATETEPATEATTETEPATEAATATEPATEAATATEPAVGSDSAFVFDYMDDNFSLDGSTMVAAKTAKKSRDTNYTFAYSDNELLSGDFTADLTFSLENRNTSAGFLFRASRSDAYDGPEGYALMIQQNTIYLYEITGTQASGMVVNVVEKKAIVPITYGETLRLRIEGDGNSFLLYYVDDMEGVTPWPEFVITLSEHKGTGIGLIDNGQGSVFTSFSVNAYEAPEAEGRQYRNPVFSEAQAADPYVLKYDGKYYCYATSAANGYYVYVSDDLVNWKNEGLCYEGGWYKKNYMYWAPEVIEYNGKFYMVISENETLGFATADSPLGPFVAERKPAFMKTIDGHFFIDDDGTPYLYYVSWRTGVYGIYGCQLDKDNLANPLIKTEKFLLSPQAGWESYNVGITEGPFMLKHDGTYYLMYSGTSYDVKEYAVGYVTSDKPLSNFKRYEGNPILSYSSKIYGPGHHGITTSPDDSEMFIVYHCHNSLTQVHNRKLCIDRIRFAPTESGVARLEVYGPTFTKQNYPK